MAAGRDQNSYFDPPRIILKLHSSKILVLYILLCIFLKLPNCCYSFLSFWSNFPRKWNRSLLWSKCPWIKVNIWNYITHVHRYYYERKKQSNCNQTFCANSREIFSSKVLEIYHTHCSKLVKFKFYELKFEILCTRLVLVR